MSDIRPFIERMPHIQQQRFAQIKPLAPVFAAISRIPLIGQVSLTASICTLLSSLSKAFTTSRLSSNGTPLLYALYHILTRAIHAASLHTRIHIRVPTQWQRMFYHSLGRDDAHYSILRAEAKYWRVAGRYGRRLYSGNGPISTPPSKAQTASREKSAVIPLVTYYTPRLLPLYRERVGGKYTQEHAGVDAVQETWVSPRTFCKWHRMVFQDACHHPTLAQAAMQIKYYSIRDLREIQRIARLLTDEQVFGHTRKVARKTTGTVTKKYREMWQKWLQNKGMDIVIVFE